MGLNVESLHKCITFTSSNNNKNKSCAIGITGENMTKLEQINQIIKANRNLSTRFAELRKAGFTVNERPFPNGTGLGSEIIVSGHKRVRVSACWSGGKASYANCVQY